MMVIQRTKRVVKSALADNITGEAAKAAYYFFLSLFPMILAAFAFTGILGGSGAFDTIMGWLNDLLPAEATAYMEQFVREVTDDKRPGALSLGLVLAIWSASNFFAALGDGLDAMFNVQSSSWWKKRLKAIALMFVGGAVLWAAAAAIVAGPQIAEALGLGTIAVILTWPIVFGLLVGLLWTIYYVLPGERQTRDRRAFLIGAVAGTLVWLAATAVFRFYVSNIADFGRTYGFIGGIIMLLLWLYITALAILLGGEVADVMADDGGGREHVLR